MSMVVLQVTRACTERAWCPARGDVEFERRGIGSSQFEYMVEKLCQPFTWIEPRQYLSLFSSNPN
ncbi:hypothetical protein M6B38_231980 [Iris pallida]|uniref:Uncharacterized protein n=1 Tax=Iris pallida TaxID=29817 RepID=A0AAX6DRA9_IRIPA|nr:hypothetical protein M6B38_231980 [Iris pallida]